MLADTLTSPPVKDTLILASASPRRLELLRQIGVEPLVQPADIVEQRAKGETPREYSRRVAHEKACAGWLACGQSAGYWVLAADTEVVIDDHVLGKPENADDAARMLQALSGREHQVFSSVALIGRDFDELVTQITRVRLATLEAPAIHAYVETGEAYGKAGAYAIQGHAAAFVVAIDGSYSSVMGLPLFETAGLLRRAGFY